MSNTMTIGQFIKTTQNAVFGIITKTNESSKALGKFVDKNGLADRVAYLPISRRQDVLVSSGDIDALKALMDFAEKLKGAEIQRRLTLTDVMIKMQERYGETQIVETSDRQGRVHQYLVRKDGYDVIVWTIIDHGIRDSARVLRIDALMDGGEVEVTGYAIYQFKTTAAGVECGEPKMFTVSDYEEPDSFGDKRDKYERCRDAVTTYKVTGGTTEEVWVGNRVKSAVAKGEDEKPAYDNAQIALAAAHDQFAGILRNIVGGAVYTLKKNFAPAPAKPKGKPSHRSRRDPDGFGKLSAFLDASGIKRLNSHAAEAAAK